MSSGDLLEKLVDLSECEFVSCALVRVVLDVIDVFVSFSSVVTEFCNVLSSCYGWEFGEPQSFSFSKKCVAKTYARRDEVRRLTSESASDNEKNDDSAYIDATFVHFS